MYVLNKESGPQVIKFMETYFGTAEERAAHDPSGKAFGAFEDFLAYMKLAVVSGLDPIEIPPHHESAYGAVHMTFVQTGGTLIDLTEIPPEVLGELKEALKDIIKKMRDEG